MTKLRPPLSFELALTRVADRIGWDETARLVGKSPSTLRAWGDPDCGPAAGAMLTLDHALALSIAYRAAGGQGSPLLHCLTAKLETEALAERGDRMSIARAVGRQAKEAGEAISWALAASLPMAGRKVVARAERECEQAVNAGMRMLAVIRARLRRPPDKDRGPEVPPPMEA